MEAYDNDHTKKQLNPQTRSEKQNGAQATFQFKSNRLEALQQVQWQEAINNSSQATKTVQFQAASQQFTENKKQPIQKKENNTGLPDALKTGVEHLSGYAMDDVKVHYNSNKPAQLQAHAYAQGTDIHLGVGQERHLPHEAWHVVQQKQGRVQPTKQLKGKVALNDDYGLEKEADIMGAKALQNPAPVQAKTANANYGVVQRVIGGDGASLQGQKVVEDGKNIPWTIIGCRGNGADLEYNIALGTFIDQWVRADDANWSIHEVVPTEQEQANGALIDSKVAANKQGVIDDFKDNLVQMADMHNSKHGAWSGGASDCVIVGGFTGEKVMMTHADRSSTALAKRIIKNSPVVYLASEIFTKGGLSAAQNGNVNEILAMIHAAKKNFVVFKSKQMAISSSGKVFTSFNIPD
jgi:hypothetical protein